jgi:hypothetical protein
MAQPLAPWRAGGRLATQQGFDTSLIIPLYPLIHLARHHKRAPSNSILLEKMRP